MPPANEMNDGTPTAHSEQYDLRGNFTVTFSFLKFSAPYKWGKLKQISGQKRPNP